MIYRLHIFLIIFFIITMMPSDLYAGTNKVKPGYTMVDGNGYPNPQGFLDPVLTVCTPQKKGCKNMRAGDCRHISPNDILVDYKDMPKLQRDGEVYPVPHLCASTVWTCNPKWFQAMAGIAAGSVTLLFTSYTGAAGLATSVAIATAVATSVSAESEDYIKDDIECVEIPKGVGPPPFCHNFRRFPKIRVVPVQQKKFPDDTPDIELNSVFHPKIRVVFDYNFRMCPDGSKVARDSRCPVTCFRVDVEGNRFTRKLYKWSCPENTQLSANGNFCQRDDNKESIPWSDICPEGYEFDGNITFANDDNLIGQVKEDAAYNLDVDYEERTKHTLDGEEIDFYTFVRDDNVCGEYLNPKLQTNVTTCYPLPKLETPEIQWAGSSANNPAFKVTFPRSGKTVDVALGRETPIVDKELTIVRPVVDSDREFAFNAICADGAYAFENFTGCASFQGVKTRDHPGSNIACLDGLTFDSGEYWLKRDGNYYYMREIDETYILETPIEGVRQSLSLEDLRQNELDTVQLVQGDKLQLTIDEHDIIYKRSDFLLTSYPESEMPRDFEVLARATVGNMSHNIIASSFVRRDGAAQPLTKAEKNNASSGFIYYIPMDLYSKGLCVNFDNYTGDFPVLRDFTSVGEDEIMLSQGQGCDFYTFEAWGGGAAGAFSAEIGSESENAVDISRHSDAFTGGAGGYGKGTLGITHLGLDKGDKLLKVNVGEGGNANNEYVGGDTQVSICNPSGEECKIIIHSIGGKSLRQAGVAYVGSTSRYSLWRELYENNIIDRQSAGVLEKIDPYFGISGKRYYTQRDVVYDIPNMPSVVDNIRLFFGAASPETTQGLLTELQELESMTWDDIYSSVINSILYNTNRNKAYRAGYRLDGDHVEWLWRKAPPIIRTWGIDWWHLNRIRKAHFNKIKDIKKKIRGIDVSELIGDVLYSDIKTGYEGDYENSRDDYDDDFRNPEPGNRNIAPRVAKSYISKKNPAGYLSDTQNPCLSNSYNSGDIIGGFDNNSHPGYGGCVNRARKLRSNGTHGKVKVTCERWIR